MDAQASRPRLLVVLVADQFRADYLQRFEHRWRSGFRTLLDEGARFTRAEYSYLSTSTCPGHTTIATGALPRTHGIVLNRWWHRDEQLLLQCMEDASSPHVSYGGKPQGGSSPRRILAPTLADRLRAENPRARVVSISLKARSAIPLAGKGGDAIVWFDNPSLAFVTSQAFAKEPVKAVRTFVARNPPERNLGQSWTLSDREQTYRQPDLGIGERPEAGWDSLFPHALVGKTKAPDGRFFDQWQRSPFADEYLAQMASALVDEFQLGQRDDVTDYLAVSFSTLDLIAHDFGPESREVEDLLIRLDRTIGAVLRTLDDKVGIENYVIALTSDHGTAPTPELSGGGHLASEDLHQLIEQTLTGLWGSRETPYVAYVGGAAVYFTDGVFDRLRREPAAMSAVTKAILSVAGMMRVLRADELSPRTTDPLVRAAIAGYAPGRSGDLFLVPRQNWVMGPREDNDATEHGTFHLYDRHVPILFRGHRIRAGRYTDLVSPADIAPTLAHLAGISWPGIDGRVLKEAVR
jgi:predicted AlkP superfamily pyrophosphatase or phosphodiesterase